MQMTRCRLHKTRRARSARAWPEVGGRLWIAARSGGHRRPVMGAGRAPVHRARDTLPNHGIFGRQFRRAIQAREGRKLGGAMMDTNSGVAVLEAAEREYGPVGEDEDPFGDGDGAGRLHHGARTILVPVELLTAEELTRIRGALKERQRQRKASQAEEEFKRRSAELDLLQVARLADLNRVKLFHASSRLDRRNRLRVHWLATRKTPVMDYGEAIVGYDADDDSARYAEQAVDELFTEEELAKLRGHVEGAGWTNVGPVEAVEARLPISLNSGPTDMAGYGGLVTGGEVAKPGESLGVGVWAYVNQRESYGGSVRKTKVSSYIT